MSGFVLGHHRRQQILLPDSLDEYVSEENPVRFINAFGAMAWGRPSHGIRLGRRSA